MTHQRNEPRSIREETHEEDHVLALAAALGLAASRRAGPETYPQRPITMIVPFAAGGPTDVVARIVGEHMSRTLGQQIVVENVAGAGGTTGITRAAQSQPDGYTIMMGHMGTHGAAPALYPEPEIRPGEGFRADRPGRRHADPDRRQEGFPGQRPEGASSQYVKDQRRQGEHGPCGRRLGVAHHLHLCSQSRSASSRPRVAYRGTGPALNDLDRRTGRLTCATRSSTWSPQIKGGTIKAYRHRDAGALAGAAGRADHQGGRPRRYEVSAWNAVFAPKGTPPEIVAKLTDALDKALDDEGTSKRLLDLGGVIPDKAGRGGAPLQKLVESEVARWTPVLKAAGATAQ